MTSYRHTTSRPGSFYVSQTPRSFSFHTPNAFAPTQPNHGSSIHKQWSPHTSNSAKLGGQKQHTKKRAEKLKETAKEAGTKRKRFHSKTKPLTLASEPASTAKKPAAKVKRAKGKSGSKGKGLLWRIRTQQDSRARICHYVGCRYGCMLRVLF